LALESQSHPPRNAKLISNFKIVLSSLSPIAERSTNPMAYCERTPEEVQFGRMINRKIEECKCAIDNCIGAAPIYTFDNPLNKERILDELSFAKSLINQLMSEISESEK